ncbi:MAG: hypothetical protein JST54_21555 [Deltaproteobacteria bacterium]|nr:hypothetical protein [Deltaproteobacteria bacterium]
MKQVFCKLAVHGAGAPRVIDTLASRFGVQARTDDPGFRVFDLLLRDHPIGTYALRLCVYALEGSDDLRALLAGSDGIAVMLDGLAAEGDAVGAIAPYVSERVPVVLASATPRSSATLFGHPLIVADFATGEGARALLLALVPRMAEVARAKWTGVRT